MDDDPPAQHFKVLVVANALGRMDYVETFPGSQTSRKCLEESKFYKELLHRSQTRLRVVGSFTAPSRWLQGAKSRRKSPSCATHGTEGQPRKWPERGTSMNLIDETAEWYRTLTRNREAEGFGGMVELIFRIMNAIAANFLGPGSGIKRGKGGGAGD